MGLARPQYIFMLKGQHFGFDLADLNSNFTFRPNLKFGSIELGPKLVFSILCFVKNKVI